MHENESVVALSKGCFVYKGSGRKASDVKGSGYDKNWNGRKQLYESAWKKIELEIENIQEKAQQYAMDDVAEFIVTSLSKSKAMQEIPTCAVMLGVNSPDHSEFFTLMSKKLNSITSHIVLLNSKDCTNIGNMMQKTVSSFISKDSSEEKFHFSKNNCTFGLLLEWYEEKSLSPQENFISSRKKKLDVNVINSPLIIILEDLEAFNPNILQDFILICSSYIDKLPLVLILGVATAITTVHNLLTPKASLCLNIESFYSCSPLDYLSQVLEIIMQPTLPFKLGPKVFNQIVDIVLFHDFSVTNLKQLLKFCLFEHYYENTTSILCCELSMLAENVTKMSEIEMDDLMRLPSFKKYLDSLEIKNQKILLNKRQEFQNTVIELLEEVHTHAYQIDILTPCLYGLTKDLPGHPFGKQKRELYQILLENDILNTEEFEKTFKLLSMLSRDDMERHLKHFLFLIDEQAIKQDMELFSELKINVEKFLKTLQNLPENSSNERNQPSSVILNWDKMTSRSQFKEKLKSLTEQKKKTPYEEWSQQVLEYLKSIFGNLRSPIKFPLHEILYFDDISAVKKHMIPSPRMTIHSALRNPHSYLQCSCCILKDPDEILPSMPDLCIVYKLHLECGKLINLHDWFQSFCAVLGETNKKKTKRKGSKKEKEAVLLRRFMNCVTELQLLGFIKQMPRKTDFVTKLTFGC